MSKNEEKRMAGDFEIIHAMRIGNREIVLGENPAGVGDERYICAFCTENGLFASYIEIMRPNIIPFLGNHEYAALTCLPWLVEELTETNTEPDVLLWRLKSIRGWMSDGGDTTVKEFHRLSRAARQDVLDILGDLTIYEETEAGGREFVLIHAGLGGFSPERALDDYQLDELILSHPDPGQTWFRDKYLVFGHTPTPYYTGVSDCRDARIFRKDKLIAIDCGCSACGPLGCICLDTLEEVYV